MWNKADLLDADERNRLATATRRQPGHRRQILVSAATGEGLPDLLAAIEERLSVGRPSYEVSVAPADGQGLAWLFENTEVLERRTNEAGETLATIRLTPGKEPRFLNRFPTARRV